MPRVLYLTTELPYFPGQGGMMALHVAYLAREQTTGVVGPRYPHQPEDSLQKLRDTLQKSHWWPEHPVPGALPETPSVPLPGSAWLKRLPRWAKLGLLKRWSGLSAYSDDALAWRQAFVNLAPKFLEALNEERWNVVLLAQSTSAAWFNFLPASLARCLFFHDIRSDYLKRSPSPVPARRLRGIEFEERGAARQADSLLFVSGLDQERASALFRPMAESAVAPICLNLDYFAYQPGPRSEPVVLFTGHLSHPPNVDAASHFLRNIWPKVSEVRPAAKFRLVGLQPTKELAEAAQRGVNVELIPNVRDIRPYFQSASVYVVPMRFGGGVRQKILEAWAVGLPVITTAMGAEGIAARDGINCWIRDQPEAFAAQIVALLDQPAPVSLLQAARREVEMKHSPVVSCPRLGAQLRLAMAKRRQSKPRVLFDLRWLQPGKSGGVEQMSRELIDEIATYDREYDYRLLGSRKVFENWRFPRKFRHQVFCPDDRNALRTARCHARVGLLAKDLEMPPLTSPALQALEWYTRLDFTVVHGLPCHVLPDLRRFPSVVTMHDLQHLHLPHFFSAEDIATREREYRDSCQRADHIICISEFTRQDVHRRYGVPLAKLTTVWNLPPRMTAIQQPKAAIRQRLAGLGINHRYFLYPAQPWLHKNHISLLQAIQLLHDRLPKDIRLVLTGQPFPAGHPAAALMGDPVVQSRVVHLGYCPTEDIASLYAGAEALIFPSLFEGFGMPVIEAMQQNCPVICGSHTSMPEIAGDAALFVDVQSPQALAEGLLRLAGDASLAGTLKAKGTKNLRRFNRRELAERTRMIYAAVHQQHFS